MTEHTRLSVQKLSKTFPGTRALDDVSLTVAAGEIRALVGGNGSGKSTLIKILAGVHQADGGGVIAVDADEIAAESVTPGWAREAGLTFVHQDLGLFEGLTVAENVFAGTVYPRRRGVVDWPRIRRETQAELDRHDIGVHATSLVGRLRPAERTNVAIVRALRGKEGRGAGVLVLDEPTARLPADDVHQLLALLRRHASSGASILYVSHHLEEILDIAATITVLRDGRVVDTVRSKESTEADVVALMMGRRLAAVETNVAPPPRRLAAPPALSIRNLRVGPLDSVDLDVAPGEIVGITGLVGSGRTTLLETVFGARAPEAGVVEVAGTPLGDHDIAAAMRHGVAYVPENRASDAAFSDLSVAANASAADLQSGRRWFGVSARAERVAADRAVDAFSIRTSSTSVPLHFLSGGNQQKVILARWMRRKPHVLLLDEPTQGIDVGARADIYDRIRQAAAELDCAVVVVSSDFDELLTLSHRIVVLAHGRIQSEAPADAIDRHWLGERVYGSATMEETNA
jgi:ribose transport system ATP-binding protein